MSLIIPIVCGIIGYISLYKPVTSEGIVFSEDNMKVVRERLFPLEECSLPRLASILDP